MSDGKQVQIVGKNAQDTSTYVGLDREVTADTDNHDLILHDGVGGKYRLLSEDNADARYQASDAEVVGIGPFTTDAAGILVRRGYQDYVLRSFTVSSDLSVTNPNGKDGDVYLALSGTISIPVTFAQGITGDVLGNFRGNGAFGAFTGAFAGPLVGPVTGNVTGNLTGNSNGTHTGAVVGNITGNVTGNLTGNVLGNVDGNITGNAGGNAATASALFNSRNIAMTGDVAWNLNFNGTSDQTAAGTIQANAVTNAKLAQMATKTVKGNASGGTTDPADLSQAQLTALVNAVVGDSGAGGTLGAVPAPGVGSAASGLALLASGLFAQVDLTKQTIGTFTHSAGVAEIKIGELYIKIGTTIGPFSESTQAVALANAFPNECLIPLAMPLHDHTYGGTDNDFWVKIVDNSITAAGFSVKVEAAAGAGGTLAGFKWIAFGR